MGNINFIPTKLGNQILRDLENDGWNKITSISNLIPEKGIDIDEYIISNADNKLIFKWDNYLEWEIIGNEQVLEFISKKYIDNYKEDDEYWK